MKNYIVKEKEEVVICVEMSRDFFFATNTYNFLHENFEHVFEEEKAKGNMTRAVSEEVNGHYYYKIISIPKYDILEHNPEQEDFEQE